MTERANIIVTSIIVFAIVVIAIAAIIALVIAQSTTPDPAKLVSIPADVLLTCVQR